MRSHVAGHGSSSSSTGGAVSPPAAAAVGFLHEYTGSSGGKYTAGTCMLGCLMANSLACCLW